MGFFDYKLMIFILIFISIYDAVAQEPRLDPYYLSWNVCTGNNYSADSTNPYKTNLNLLLSSLSTTFTNNKTIPLYGYRNITIGESPDIVYGSLHCREDIAPAICSECAQIATDEVTKDTACPNSKGAIMFYNGCTLRYSDKYYFSLKEQSPNTGYLNLAEKNEIPVEFTNILAGLLDGLVIEAVTNKSSGSSPSFFATGSTNYSSSNQVYGMVQCTPDITPALCNRCLATNLQQEYTWAQRNQPPVLPGIQPSTSTMHRISRLSTILVGWSHPQPEWIKINTDGAARGHPGLAGAGVICRNEYANTILAIAQPLGITTAFTAETWAMLIAARTATDREWPKVNFETDSETLLRFLNSETESPWYLSNMITEIKLRLAQIPHYTINHIYKEGNQAADGLANKAADDGATGTLTTTIWDHNTPTCINPSVIADSLGTLYPRCNRCLRTSIGTPILVCCPNSKGGIVLTPSCTFRYENFPFAGKSLYTTHALAPTPLLSPPSTLQSPPNTTKSTGNNATKLAVIVAVPSGIAALLLSFFVVWWFCFHKRKRTDRNKYHDTDQDIQSAESLQFNFNMICDATNNFAKANYLGEGGFGPVYKGVLSDGQEIAVKRLSQSSGQGDLEFKNEVLLLAKLQHRNLVRLLGFCLHGEEKLLVYELMDASLDHIIFDVVKRTYLDWEIRYKIVGGIARGLLYLHEDSRVRIIHRDLKASNILLAADMTPKISDFGMARLFVADQTQAATMRIVGTYGYMAPEYAMHGRFSVKSDVLSFGVLVLEILSGKRNTSFYESVAGGAQDLLTHAWSLWHNGSTMELLDSSLKENCSKNEFMRCVHIALLCVQESVADRPTMASVILMLNSNSMTLTLPTRPTYYISNQRNEETWSATEVSGIEEAWSVNEVSASELDPR